MIISDLNVLETVEATGVVGGHGYKKPDYKVNQKIEIDFNEKIKKIVKVESKPDIKDNTAVADSKAYAEGKNTFTNTFNEAVAGEGYSQSQGVSVAISA